MSKNDHSLRLSVSFLFLSIPCCLPAQDPGKAGSLTERVARGEALSTAEWRRAADGTLQARYSGESKDSDAPATDAEFTSLLGEGLRDAFLNCGLIGYLALCCQGDGDLLGMTDAEYHFRCLGIDTQDVGLRQFVMRPIPPSAGGRGRAELFDRLLAIDLLLRRRCKAAAGELAALAGRDGVPAVLRERAHDGAGALRGTTSGVARQRLDPASLPLPDAFDGCLVIDHARLPDMSWLTGMGRRLSMRISAQLIDISGAAPPPAVLADGQRLADVVAELPFGVALRFGNVRYDHSCILVSAAEKGPLPVVVAYNTAGRFEHEVLARSLEEDYSSDILDLTEAPVIGPDRMQWRTKGLATGPRPGLARELLANTGAAIRVLVPEDSRLWSALGILGLPAAEAAELQVRFEETFTLHLKVTTSDEQAAADWVGEGKKYLAIGRRQADEWIGAAGKDSGKEDPKELRAVIDAVLDAKLTADAAVARATVTISGFDRHAFQRLFEQLAGGNL